VLYTLTEHVFQELNKKRQKHWENAYMRKGITSRAVETSRPKAGFFQMAAPAPEIMDNPTSHQKVL
jgi:hypothetical protein